MKEQTMDIATLRIDTVHHILTVTFNHLEDQYTYDFGKARTIRGLKTRVKRELKRETGINLGWLYPKKNVNGCAYYMCLYTR